LNDDFFLRFCVLFPINSQWVVEIVDDEEASESEQELNSF
jgi:hypothetical protein